MVAFGEAGQGDGERVKHADISIHNLAWLDSRFPEGGAEGVNERDSHRGALRADELRHWRGRTVGDIDAA